jgi:hypothetical protein
MVSIFGLLCQNIQSIIDQMMFLGGPIVSLVDYHAPPQKRLWLFIVPEFIGFAGMGFDDILRKVKKK